MTTSPQANTINSGFVSIEFPGSGIEISLPFIEMEIVEGLDQTFMYGQVTIKEVSFTHRLVIGGEKIRINLSSEFENNDYKKTFVIYAKSPVEMYPSGHRFFRLHFKSEEALVAEDLSLSKGFNQSVPNTVRAIFNEVIGLRNGNKLEIDSESSTTPANIISPGIPVDQLLQLCKMQTFSNDGIPYALYESKNGFHFKCVSKLWETYEPDEIFVYDAAGSVRSLGSTPVDTRPLKIEYLRVQNQFDLDEMLLRGAFKSITYTLDMRTKEYGNVTFNLPDHLNTFFDKPLSNPPYEDDLMQLFTLSADSGLKRFYATTDDYAKEHSKNIGKMISYETLMSAVNVQFKQTNTKYLFETGNCINLNFDRFVRFAESNPSNEENKLLNGRYLVSKIVHRVTSRESGIDYVAIVEAVRMGYGDAV